MSNEWGALSDVLHVLCSTRQAMTAPEIIEASGWSSASVYAVLVKMTAHGLVKPPSLRRGGRWGVTVEGYAAWSGTP